MTTVAHFARGFADQQPGFNLEKEDEILIQSLKARGDSRAEEQVKEEDDVVCIQRELRMKV